jgi:hypothetical protein
MKTLPLYCEHFLTLICSMVMQYKVRKVGGSVFLRPVFNNMSLPSGVKFSSSGKLGPQK